MRGSPDPAHGGDRRSFGRSARWQTFGGVRIAEQGFGPPACVEVECAPAQLLTGDKKARILLYGLACQADSLRWICRGIGRNEREMMYWAPKIACGETDGWK